MVGCFVCCCVKLGFYFGFVFIGLVAVVWLFGLLICAWFGNWWFGGFVGLFFGCGVVYCLLLWVVLLCVLLFIVVSSCCGCR